MTFLSSIMQKQIMAVTGLLLCTFTLTHLLGNLLIIISAKTFNLYAHALISNPLILPMETLLLLIFLIHIIISLKVKFENRRARPKAYYKQKSSQTESSFASNSMLLTGIFLFIFLIFHIIELKFGSHYLVDYSGEKIRDLHKLIMEYFSSSINVIKYIVVMIALGIHSSHGFSSAFQSLGIGHCKKIAKFYGIIITIGFSSLPIWCYFQKISHDVY